MATASSAALRTDVEIRTLSLEESIGSTDVHVPQLPRDRALLLQMLAAVGAAGLGAVLGAPGHELGHSKAFGAAYAAVRQRQPQLGPLRAAWRALGRLPSGALAALVGAVSRHTAGLWLVQGPPALVRLLLHERLRVALARPSPLQVGTAPRPRPQPSWWGALAAGAGAGVAAELLAAPLARLRALGSPAAVERLVAGAGPTALWRGASLSLVAAAPLHGVALALHHRFTLILNPHPQRDPDATAISFKRRLLAASLASVLGLVVVHPLEQVMSLVQDASPTRTDQLRAIVRDPTIAYATFGRTAARWGPVLAMQMALFNHWLTRP